MNSVEKNVEEHNQNVEEHNRTEYGALGNNIIGKKISIIASSLIYNPGKL